ncbi:MAG: NfeD family protein [Actinomycetota bacterium]
MRSRLALLCCAAAAFASWSGVASAQTQTQTPSPAPSIVEVIQVEGAIDRPLLAYLTGKLDAAEAEGATVILQLDTSGTLSRDPIALAERVATMRVPVIAWVGPVPAKAAGAGLLLMYASSLAAVQPGAQVGPLMPLDLGHPDAAYPGLQQRMQGWIRARGKNTITDWDDRALTGQEALGLGIIQASAASIPDLLNTVDGRTVLTAGGPVTLRTKVATTRAEAEQGTIQLRFNGLGPVQRVQHGVSTPSMIYFLLVLGLGALAFETTQPGFGFAGFSGIGMVLLAAYGLTVAPVSWLGLLLLVGGVGLMVADVRLRRLGPLTWAGLAAFLGGSALAWHGIAHDLRISPWLIGGAVLASLLYYGFALTVAQQSHDRIVNTQRGLIGLVGEARGRLAPEGPVYVKGALWRGRSAEGEIVQGARVRVRGVDGLVLRVEAEPTDPVGPPVEA